MLPPPGARLTKAPAVLKKLTGCELVFSMAPLPSQMEGVPACASPNKGESVFRSLMAEIAPPGGVSAPLMVIWPGASRLIDWPGSTVTAAPFPMLSTGTVLMCVVAGSVMAALKLAPWRCVIEV